ncbi:hypothetical protein GALL_537610 [mine drainage metagenome]|uniref:Uncharacterized protein n=1 Tax=mine drainage metagenome TaxID=410659 RepID=A0A1J5PA43_9ZZZZ
MENGFLDQAGQHPAAFALAAGDLGEVNVDLIDTPVFNLWRNVGNDALEEAGVVPVLGKIDRQQNRLRTQLGRFHQAHGRADAKLACRIGGGGDDPAPGVIGQAGKVFYRDFAGWPMRVGLLQSLVDSPPGTANDHRQAFELRVAQQLHRGVKGIHVEVGNSAHDDGQAGYRVGGLQG